MGYTTTFTGELKFAKEPTVPQIVALKDMFGEDCRDHPEWGATNLYYIDLELNEDYTGIRHDGSEKTYELEKLVNVVIREMRKQWPDFALTGKMMAQGETFEDRWILEIGAGGFATNTPLAITGKVTKCPHCNGKFVEESPQ